MYSPAPAPTPSRAPRITICIWQFKGRVPTTLPPSWNPFNGQPGARAGPEMQVVKDQASGTGADATARDSPPMRSMAGLDGPDPPELEPIEGTSRPRGRQSSRP